MNGNVSVYVSQWDAKAVPPEILAEGKRLNRGVRRGRDYRLHDRRTRGCRFIENECQRAAEARRPWRPDLAGLAFEIAPREVPFMSLLARKR